MTDYVHSLNIRDIVKIPSGISQILTDAVSQSISESSVLKCMNVDCVWLLSEFTVVHYAKTYSVLFFLRFSGELNANSLLALRLNIGGPFSRFPSSKRQLQIRDDTTGSRSCLLQENVAVYQW